ncbi:hypothetical protein [Neisseria polysaccharea]|nr:hypothetical protein [Neisseria polysaccharea]
MPSENTSDGIKKTPSLRLGGGRGKTKAAKISFFICEIFPKFG